MDAVAAVAYPRRSALLTQHQSLKAGLTGECLRQAPRGEGLSDPCLLERPPDKKLDDIIV